MLVDIETYYFFHAYDTCFKVDNMISNVFFFLLSLYLLCRYSRIFLGREVKEYSNG